MPPTGPFRANHLKKMPSRFPRRRRQAAGCPNYQITVGEGHAWRSLFGVLLADAY
jgi:hypothetical protein